jgi:hypothetical protein
MTYMMGVDFAQERAISDVVRALFEQVTSEVRGELLGEFSTLIADLRSQAPQVTVAAPDVTVTPQIIVEDNDDGQIAAKLDALTAAFHDLAAVLRQPVTRTITHDADGRIIKVVESR